MTLLIRKFILKVLLLIKKQMKSFINLDTHHSFSSLRWKVTLQQTKVELREERDIFNQEKEL